ncbi:calphotin-like isoform X2 [Anthonomus grandis grandis]|uniref:calphotin-like isoform X2 n=1 Tax=Anthonomus grandis grandis TaxID=2921223 RepID=UPI0021667A2D|nr:calphotin-like isoform X2 [Anthonomus grandis grandis]
MKLLVVILLIGACHSAPHEGLPLLNPGGIGGVFKGPNSETIIQGPDGSQITSKEESGSIVQNDGLASSPIIVAESEIALPAPVLSEELLAPSVGPIISSTGAPIISSVSPELLTGEIDPQRLDIAPLPQVPIEQVVPLAGKPIEIVEQDPHIVETEIIEAPEVEPEQSSDLQGPSGRIITKGSASIVSGPASTTITEPRKIIFAPPKINIPIVEAPLPVAPLPIAAVSTVSPLPVVVASTVTPLPTVSLESRSTLVPDGLSYSSTPASIDLGYSTSIAPNLGSAVSTVGYDSSRIDLGGGDLGQSIPVLSLSASNGIINGQNLGAVGAISTTEAPVLSSTLSAISTEGYQISENHPVPSAYLSAPAVPTVIPDGFSTAANIQKIPRIEQSLAVDDRIGELTQNEISKYDPRSYLNSPDLAQSKYLGPALARNGLDPSQVQLDEVPLSSVTRFADGAYKSNIRYGRHAKGKN